MSAATAVPVSIKIRSRSSVSYEVFGDSSTNDYLTPSQDSVYLRLQQDAAVLDAEPNFFMWGRLQHERIFSVITAV